MFELIAILSLSAAVCWLFADNRKLRQHNAALFDAAVTAEQRRLAELRAHDTEVDVI
jgi:hypothetical protein